MHKREDNNPENNIVRVDYPCIKNIIQKTISNTCWLMHALLRNMFVVSAGKWFVVSLTTNDTIYMIQKIFFF
jgi:hypothetical protein